MAKQEPPFKRLLRNYSIDEVTSCWNWEGHKFKNGYGCIKSFTKMVSVHRLSYELHNGTINTNMEILHSCDNKLCINPDHLKQGTHGQNMKDAADRGLMRKGETHPMRVNGSPSKGSNSKQSMQVMVLGKPYGSLKEAERSLGLGSGTVAYWCKEHPNKAYKLTMKEYEDAKRV